MLLALPAARSSSCAIGLGRSQLRTQDRAVGIPLVRLIAFSMTAVLFSACQVADSPQLTAPKGQVSFHLNAPFCSSILPMQFFIDQVQVGSDTFRVGLPNQHVTSGAFETPAGPHVLAAHAFLGQAGTYVWPDTTITLERGGALIDTLPFYCS